MPGSRPPSASGACWLLLMLLMADALAQLRAGAAGARARCWRRCWAPWRDPLVGGAGAAVDPAGIRQPRARLRRRDAAAPRRSPSARSPRRRRSAFRWASSATAKRRLRGTTLPVLSFLQTIPSLAMFGLMIPILGWVGDSVPGRAGDRHRRDRLRPRLPGPGALLAAAGRRPTPSRASPPRRPRRSRRRAAWA